jgi:hypothetical protein
MVAIENARMNDDRGRIKNGFKERENVLASMKARIQPRAWSLALRRATYKKVSVSVWFGMSQNRLLANRRLLERGSCTAETSEIESVMLHHSRLQWQWRVEMTSHI